MYRERKKRLFCYCLITLAMLMSGCGEKEEDKTPITIRIPVYDRGYEDWDVTDNDYTDWVQQEFGDKNNIQVEYVAISRSMEVNHYMQLLASGTAPDIIFHYDMPQMMNYYSEEVLQGLDLRELEQYAPSYWEKLSDTISTYGNVDGRPYYFFAERPEAYNYVTLIRKDWLEVVGMEMPTCLEELNEVLTAWRDAGLGNGGGKLLMDSFIYDYPFRDAMEDEKERALYSDLSVAALPWEPTHQYLKNLNYQYNHDLIDKEFYLNMDEASTYHDFVTGKSGIFEFYISSESHVMDDLLEHCPDAEVAYMPKCAESPKGYMPYARAYWPFGIIMGMNRETTEEERIAVWMYLEWLSREENLFVMQNGVEGHTMSQNKNKDYWCLVTESAKEENEQRTHQANVKNWAPTGYEYIIEDSYRDYQAMAPYRTQDVLFDTPLASVAKYRAELREKWIALYIKCVMAPEGEFEAVYQEACEEYMDAGYREILEEKKRVLFAN